MRCRFLVVIALGACSFSTRGAPGDGGGGDDDASDGRGPDVPVDARPCFAVEVGAMSSRTCARMENGDTWCWGINTAGQVGVPPQTTCAGIACNPMPAKVSLPPVSKLGVGEEHTCAIAGPTVYCWGRDLEKQFGDGTSALVPAPIAVAQRAGASSIGGGLYYGCSLHAGAVRCAGNNASGEVGDPLRASHDTPFTAVPSGTSFLVNGYSHVCTVQGGFVYCWGANFNGQVNTTPGGPVYNPSLVTGLGTVSVVATGFAHTCAALASGVVKCWGANGTGQLGTGDSMPHMNEIVDARVLGIVELAAGSDHTCGRTAAGSVYCWGDRFGAIPIEVTLPHPAVSIGVGSSHDCFALDDGTVRCLGANNFGQLGTGTPGAATNTLSQALLCP